MTNWDNSRSSQTYNFWTNSLKKKNQHLNRSEDFSTQPACRLIVAAEAWTNNLLLIWFSRTDRLSTIFSYSPLSNLLWQNQDQVGQSWNKSPDLYIYHLHLIYIFFKYSKRTLKILWNQNQNSSGKCLYIYRNPLNLMYRNWPPRNFNQKFGANWALQHWSFREKPSPKNINPH